jgi:hypothetical protein
MLTEAEILRFGIQCQFERRKKVIHSTLPLLSTLCDVICEKLRPDLNVIAALCVTPEFFFDLGPGMLNKREQIHAKLENGEWLGQGKLWRIQRIPYECMFGARSFLVREIRLDTLGFLSLLMGENTMAASQLTSYSGEFGPLEVLLQGLSEKLLNISPGHHDSTILR